MHTAERGTQTVAGGGAVSEQAASGAPVEAGRGQALYRRARLRIPGGTQLLSKRPEMLLPENWPAYFSRARGAEVWDLDGRRYVDMSYNGIGACVLGAADPEVDAAVMRAIASGTASTLNCPEEVELAELLCELHPWADAARFARSGGEAMSVAVRIARAATGRDVVAFCGYHGWCDWYLAANLADDAALDGHLLAGLSPAGVPRALAGTARPFRYNQLDELESLVAQSGDQLAAIVMEPMRRQPPAPGFLEGVRDIATRCGAVLVFDEITAGLRMNTGGLHLTLGVEPDVAVFAKALGNGYPISAVIGREGVMAAAQRTFISSTMWSERIGPAAALATLRKHAATDAAQRLIAIGQRVQAGWRLAAERSGLAIDVGGLAPLATFSFVHDDALALRTLFTQEMLRRGWLASGAFYATTAHTDEQAAGYLVAVDEVFDQIAKWIHQGDWRRRLAGPVAHGGFQRLT